MTKQDEIISQQVIIPNILITELESREYAEMLTREVGVRLHFDIPYHKMPYYRHYRSADYGDEVWEFSSRPLGQRVEPLIEETTK